MRGAETRGALRPSMLTGPSAAVPVQLYRSGPLDQRVGLRLDANLELAA